jgi:hypothetical protein
MDLFIDNIPNMEAIITNIFFGDYTQFDAYDMFINGNKGG